MKRIIILFTLILTITTSLWAGIIQTDTHAYIVSKECDCILAIDRQTGAETEISVGKYPTQMVIHEKYGYALNFGSVSVSVIDLETHQVIKTISIENQAHIILVHKQYGYALSTSSDTLYIIDLDKHEVIKTIYANTPRVMTIYGEHGYVVNYISGTVSVLDLENHQIIKTLKVGVEPDSIIVHENMGYVVNEKSQDVTVLDLQRQEVVKTIPVGTKPRPMVIHGNKGYIVNASSSSVSVIDLHKHEVISEIRVILPDSITIHNNYSYIIGKQVGTIRVIDLETLRLIKDIYIPSKAMPMIIIGNRGYIEHEHAYKVSVINLTTNKLITTLNNPHSSLNFADQFIFFGTKISGFLFKDTEALIDYIKKREHALGKNRYEDVLSPQDILALLQTQNFYAAWHLFLSLYQPLKFLETPEGKTFCASLLIEKSSKTEN